MTNKKILSILLTAIVVLLFFALGAMSVSATTSAPVVEWEKTFDSAVSSCSVQQTSDGGYIIFTTGKFSTEDLIKIDSNGSQQWKKTFNMYGDNICWSHGECHDRTVRETFDQDGNPDGYVFVGTKSISRMVDPWSAEHKIDVYLVKTDSDGNIECKSAFDRSHDYYPTGYDGDHGRSVQQTSDGGYIITGTRGYTPQHPYHPDVYLIKTYANGNEEWSNTFGGVEIDNGCSVQQTKEGGYIIVGSSILYGVDTHSDVYLIKTYADGTENWTKKLGGADDDVGYSVQQTSDGGYIIAGETFSFGAGKSDVYLIKRNSDGNEEWSKTFGGSDYEAGYSVQQTSDGGYIVAGYTGPYAYEGDDFYLIKTDANGTKEWSKTSFFSGLDGGKGYSVQQTCDGGYIVAGVKYTYLGEKCEYGECYHIWDSGRLYLVKLSGESLGVVTDVRGDVSVSGESVQVGDSVSLGDLVETGLNGYVEIALGENTPLNGTTIELNPNSEMTGCITNPEFGLEFFKGKFLAKVRELTGEKTDFKTGSSGYVKINYGDTKTDIGPSSEVKMYGAANQTSLDLIWGKMRAKIKKLSGEQMEIIMPQAAVGVRGTEVVVEAGGSGSQVMVLEGEVHVSNLDRSQSISLGEYQGVVATGTGLGASFPVDPSKVDRWWLWWGDINGDGDVNLTDAILALQVISGMNPIGVRSDYASSGADVNEDGKIGLEEVIYTLQVVSELR